MIGIEKMRDCISASGGIEADFGPEQADTFRRDLHPDLRADYVLANPPFQRLRLVPQGRRRALARSPGVARRELHLVSIGED